MRKILEKLAASDNDRYNKPPVTIAFIGDSVTQGCFEIYKTGKSSLETVYEPNNAYSEKFRALLRTVFPRAQINVVNAGISGDSAPRGLIRLRRDALSFSPDLLVVCYGLNDATVGEDGLEPYENALREIFAQAKKNGAEVIFMTPNMMCTRAKYDADPYFAKLNASICEYQISGIMDKYMDAARRAAIDGGVAVCDCYKKWKALAAAGANTTALLCNNVNHPTRDLHTLFAYSLFDTVLSD